MNASWTGSSFTPPLIPTIVVISAPSASQARYRQDDTDLPSTYTVQQPHKPCPQLSRAPFSSKWPDNISISVSCGMMLAETLAPFSLKRILRGSVISILGKRMAVELLNGAEDRLRRQRQLGQVNADGIGDRIADGRA